MNAHARPSCESECPAIHGLREELDDLGAAVQGLRAAGDAREAQLGALITQVQGLQIQGTASSEAQIAIRDDLRELRSDLRADLRAERRQTMVVVVVALALVAGIALGTAQIDLLGVGVSVGQ